MKATTVENSQPSILPLRIALAAVLSVCLGTGCSYFRPPANSQNRDVAPAEIRPDGAESPTTLPASLP